jgi:hypothetical protein
VPAQETAIALDSARGVAATFGTALIEVRIEPGQAAVAVSAPEGHAAPAGVNGKAPAMAAGAPAA